MVMDLAMIKKHSLLKAGVALTFLALSAPSYAIFSSSLSNENLAPPSSSIQLPQHIPAQCVAEASRRYQVPELALLAILKQESGGRLGIVSQNTNGSKDYGPAQFNDRSWGRYMRQKYDITLNDLTNNMCQALMAQAYALRSEWNRCIKKGQTSIWCAVAYYHSPTKKYQERYVNGVWKQYQSIVSSGRF